MTDITNLTPVQRHIITRLGEGFVDSIARFSSGGLGYCRTNGGGKWFEDIARADVDALVDAGLLRETICGGWWGLTYEGRRVAAMLTYNLVPAPT